MCVFKYIKKKKTSKTFLNLILTEILIDAMLLGYI